MSVPPREPDTPEGTVTLSFRDHSELAHVDDDIFVDLSSAARVGDSLFATCDETAGVDRLLPQPDGSWADHDHYNLGELFDLPDGPGGEMDIEGLHVSDGCLWIVGSHSLKRGKPKAKDDPAKALERMRKIKRDPNRFFLARVPLREEEPGQWAPCREAGGQTARSIELLPDGSRLKEWLAEDDMLAPYLDLPSKENGFDIEGIAAAGMRIWLGLRGPCFRGAAAVLEIEMAVDGSGHLVPAETGGSRYRKYLVPSDGLGVRDLLVDGDDLLLMLGPTMGSDGPARVLRWSGAVGDRRSIVVPEDRLRTVCELPYHGQHDHPEGIAFWPEAGEGRVLILYDSPLPSRVDEANRTVTADIFALE